MANRYFQVAQIFATITGFMFLIWSILYTTAFNQLSESNTALRHSSDMILSFPQFLLTLKSLNLTINDTNFTTTYINLYQESSRLELDRANSYAQLFNSSFIGANNILITASVFIIITLILALLGYFQNMLDRRRNNP